MKILIDVYVVSKPAPSFEGVAVINGEFKEVMLSDFKGKYLVLLFYPLDLYVK
jgi:peroxiredoxin (alkyl hydroperoxide reductase subunit C)